MLKLTLVLIIVPYGIKGHHLRLIKLLPVKWITLINKI